MTIDVGAGMRSADIPDGREHSPDEGTCPVCRARGRLKKDDTMRQHWRYGWSRRGGNPPCAGSSQKPAVLNERRVTRYLAQVRHDAANAQTSCEGVSMSDGTPQTIDDITETDVKRITGWIGRHALPTTLPQTMPEYSTALALDMVVTSLGLHLKARLPLSADLATRNAVRTDWNLLVTAARAWSTEPEYPGWKPIDEP